MYGGGLAKSQWGRAYVDRVTGLGLRRPKRRCVDDRRERREKKKKKKKKAAPTGPLGRRDREAQGLLLHAERPQSISAFLTGILDGV